MLTRSGSFVWMSEGVLAILRRRIASIVGFVVVVAALLLMLALISYSADDPSLNHATDNRPDNWLGGGGAVIADLMLQLGGTVAVLPAVAAAVWGWRMATNGTWNTSVVQLVLTATALLLLAVAAAGLPLPDGWPFVAGLGGVIGDALLSVIDGVVGRLVPDLGTEIVVAAAGVVGIFLITIGLGLSRSHLRGITAGIAQIGMLGARVLNTSRAVLLRVSSGGRHHRATDTGQTERPQGGEVRAFRPDGVAIDTDLVAPKAPRARSGRKAEAERQTSFDFAAAPEYRGPGIDLLRAPPPDASAASVNREGLEQNARLLSTVLEDFGVRGDIVKVRPGPVITLYELEPAPGTKTSRVIGLADDIARSMSAVSVRVAVVPGRNVIGIELPNQRRETVFLRELLGSEGFERNSGALILALGKDIGGAPVFVDLARMPHLLIAGTTGSGKSVAINTMILSLLYRLPPETCRFILIDPKMLELSVYDDIPHLLTPVVTDPGKAVVALKWTVREMEERYRMMSQLGVRNIAGFNARVAEARAKQETLVRRVQTGFDDEGQPRFEDVPLDLAPLPFIVVVVDEMADLMLVAGKDIEAAVQRLAQMARAAGIHLIMATQRPSVDVITGTIKANFPTRISFQVTSKIDSRTILGEQGAEQLLGQGDMLYMATGGRLIRVHGPFVADQEVEAVVATIRQHGQPDYVTTITEEADNATSAWSLGEPDADGANDELYTEAVAMVAREGKVSTSYVQRRLQIGYNRAARIVERMESEGLVSKPDRVGRREVLVGERVD